MIDGCGRVSHVGSAMRNHRRRNSIAGRLSPALEVTMTRRLTLTIRQLNDNDPIPVAYRWAQYSNDSNKRRLVENARQFFLPSLSNATSHHMVLRNATTFKTFQV